MREVEVPVCFEPQGRTVYVLKRTKILEAASNAGITLDVPCGGQGTCGKCRVRVTRNACPPTEAEKTHLSGEEIESGVRLACQSCVCGPATIEVPETSVMASTFQILGGSEAEAVDVADVAVRKRYVELPAPSREDDAPDLDRLQRAIGDCTASLALLRELPVHLRAWDFKGTAVMADHRLIDFERGDTESECYAVAFDVGTTTLVGVLLDLTTGHESASVSRMNPQTSMGDDVLSRILFASEDEGGLGKLRGSVVDEINDMIDELARQAGIAHKRIYEASFAGNTTMQSLMEGVDPSPLGGVPFSPATGSGLLLGAEELGLRLHPRGRAYVFPVIGGFVGGDTVSCIVATGLVAEERPTMLIDIGTNGEIVVANGTQVLATSTAAGPAFEGARIRQGMRASAGAIEKFIVEDGEVRINVVGNVAPVGLCGSALVDAAAELLRHGVLMSEGLLLGVDDLPEGVPEAMRKRVILTEDGAAFVLASAEESGIDGPVLLTQADLRELQLATAAIRAGVSILVKRAGLEMGDLHQVLIAGGFGNFIRRSNAQRIGLLPTDVERSRIRFVGNASLNGSRLAAVSQRVRAHAQAVARQIVHVDLSMDAAFQEEYVQAMFFPHHDGK